VTSVRIRLTVFGRFSRLYAVLNNIFAFYSILD